MKDKHGANCACFRCTSRNRAQHGTAFAKSTAIVAVNPSNSQDLELERKIAASQAQMSSLYAALINAPSWQQIFERANSGPPPELERHESTETIVGWRMWAVEDLGRLAVLRSVFQLETLWPIGQALRAGNAFGGYVGGGIHAFKTEEGARAYGEEARSYHGGAPRLGRYSLYQSYHMEPEYGVRRPIVYGTVALWGFVVEHELGYRAEFAYPQSIRVPENALPGVDAQLIARKIANTYGLDVELAPSIL